MRNILIVATAALSALAFTIGTAAAQGRADSAFCIQQGGANGTLQCEFNTLAQCQAALKGAGNVCVPNPKASR